MKGLLIKDFKLMKNNAMFILLIIFISIGCALEEKEQKYSVEKHAKRLGIILEKWEKIREIIREEIPTQKAIETILDKIGAPKTVKELGINCDLTATLKATKDIRDKYVLSRLLWDLGVIEEIL